MKSAVMVAVLACGCASQPGALGNSAEAKQFAPLAFLVGDWEGVAVGSTGQSVGSFTVAPDLSTRVLIRRGFNTSAGGALHEDLMVIYPEATGFRADYWDNESHVLHYHVYPQPQAKQVVMESNPLPDGTTFRLSYRALDDNSLEVHFDLAPAGKDYTAYLQGTVKRRVK